MHADVERFTFDPADRFLRVIEQQGRVAMAADTNEQTAILLDYLRQLAVDLIGPYGVPGVGEKDEPGDGFRVEQVDNALRVHAGRYWVEGIPVVNDVPVDLTDLPKLSGRVVVYLDVWERHLSAAQVPRLRDVALGGPDTCSRSQVVWQVKVHLPEKPPADNLAAARFHERWPEWRAEIEPPDRGRLAVEAKRPEQPEPCPAPPDAGYVGPENQLYRVEVHRGRGPEQEEPPTFKWSRDNGSVVYPLASVDGAVVVLRDPPLDCRKQLTPGVLVEVVDDLTTLATTPGHLARVADVDDDGDDVVVHLDAPVPRVVSTADRPLLRRWDHPAVGGTGDDVPTEADDRALTVVEDGERWFTLEDGIRIRFAPRGNAPRVYRTGDYWTFAARTATGEVEWPRDGDVAREVAPHGVDHHYAPLATVLVAGGTAASPPDDYRPVIRRATAKK